MKQTLKYLTALLCAVVCSFAPASADETRLIGDEIIAFFEQQQQSAPSNVIRSTEVEGAIVQLMNEVSESLFTADKERLETALSVATNLAFIDQPAWPRTVAFAKDIGKIFDTSPPADRSKNLLGYLDSFNANDDWYLHSVSKSLAAYFYVSTNQILIGTERLDNAMAVIPSELSVKVTTARILASGVAMVLHGLQGNPEFLLDAARIQAKGKATVGEDINRHELMTNFIFALNRSRQYEAAAQVAELLINEPMPADSIAGLSEAYMAATFNELKYFAKAETLARAALANSDHPVVNQRGGLELLVSLAGLGKKDEAATLMMTRKWDHSPAELLSTVSNQSILHAEALLAMHRDEAPYALALMKRRADILINQVQTENSTDISGMLSNLENTRERQVEREGALQREAELKAVQLEQKTNLNRLLWVLIAGLTIAFNFLLAFLRYREKLNVKVQGLQEDALSAEKMKTEFLGIINHELRTPLNGIIGISDAMIHHAPSPIMREQAEAVQQSGQLLFDLLDSLITMSTIEGDRLTLDKEEANLAKTIIREVDEWDTVAANKGLVFTHFIDSELQDPVVGDHKRIRQSLRYLLSNAVRFTHAGRVHLHATAAPDIDGHLAVTIVVADTGQGISEDVQSRLFKPFLQADATMTRKYGGAGLSLAIARKLARMMDGDLVVNSREGRGTEFTFTARLPLADTAAQTLEGKTNTPQKLIVPDLDGLDDPTAIIDLMLGEQLGGRGSQNNQRPRKNRFKTAS